MTQTFPHSCLYQGEVMHKRLRPARHRFRYRVFSMFLDIDALPELDRAHRWFHYNRAGWLSFHDRDHGPRDGTPLRPWIERRLADAGLAEAGHRVFLLCFPRLAGYVFNPLSIYFCYRVDGALAAILYEVKNTFGEQHAYVLPVASDGDAAQHGCSKAFYVSPFLEMESDYRFRIRPPDERLSVLIRQRVRGTETLIASQIGRRRPFNDASLRRALLGHPLMTFKVIAAIHWEALRLWWKGVPLIPMPTSADTGLVDKQEQGETALASAFKAEPRLGSNLSP
ncbi:MAG: DUF1365 domain-containing protein [Alphaproteobacteria bacterium]|nr:DUF1365 domain-containing protein [Alphaproteobacteria bacterium]